MAILKYKNGSAYTQISDICGPKGDKGEDGISGAIGTINAGQTASNIYPVCAPSYTQATGSSPITAQMNQNIYIKSTGVLMGAAWNDYAEYRKGQYIKPGTCVVENGDGTLKISTDRLQRGASIVSDTFGFAIGYTDDCKIPLAICGRVLAYTYQDKKAYKAGDPICTAPNGTIDKMTDEEVQKYPDRIIGFVSEIPNYMIWKGQINISVDDRIWIRVK